MYSAYPLTIFLCLSLKELFTHCALIQHKEGGFILTYHSWGYSQSQQRKCGNSGSVQLGSLYPQSGS